MKMHFSVPTAVAFLSLLCCVSANTRNITCQDNENPFNLKNGLYKLPSERLNRGGWGGATYKKPEDMPNMVLKWIPRDSLSCASNQLPPGEVLTKFKFTENETYRTISLTTQCNAFITRWLHKLKTVILHNLLIVIKAQSVSLFNEFYDLKFSAFGPEKLLTDQDEDLIDVLENLRQDLKNGLTLPLHAKTPTYESFNEVLGDSIQIYRDIQNVSSKSRVIVSDCKYAAFLNREKTRNECVQTVLTQALGKFRSEPNLPVAISYGDYTDYLDKGIRLIGKHFDVPIVYITNLPNVQPCFEVNIAKVEFNLVTD